MEEIINFDINESIPTRIRVIGVGGGGGNAVKFMCKSGIYGADFLICNTDNQVMSSDDDDDDSNLKVIQIGKTITRGFGSGNNPDLGRQSAEEDIEDIREALSGDIKMVFVTACLGGGTGSGAAPVIAKTAKNMDLLTIGVVTIPERSEGPKRLETARKGVAAMKEVVDSLIIIDNERIAQIYGTKRMSEALHFADSVLLDSVKGVAELITRHSYINVDFADVRTITKNSGVAVIGTSKASGDDRALKAIEDAISSPLLNNNDVNGAKNVMFNITYGTKEIMTDELIEITDYILSQVGDESTAIWGVGEDLSLGDALSVTVIATGFRDFSYNFINGQNNKENDTMTINANDVKIFPEMTAEEIKKIKETPAYNRRKLKVL